MSPAAKQRQQHGGDAPPSWTLVDGTAGPHRDWLDDGAEPVAGRAAR